MSNEFMLTTVDNPFDPFEQFDSWLMFDKEKGYDSCEKIARTVELTSDMTQKEIDKATDEAIEKIIKYDFTNTFKKFYRQTTT